MRSFVLLHTNDMHGRLSRSGAELIRDLKAAERNVLLVDAGDAVRAGNLGITLWGETVLDRMGDAGYDVMAAGNRETHLWGWAARAKTGRAQFPVLCANVAGPGAHAGQGVPVVPEAIRAYARDDILFRRSLVVRLPNGMRVALLGLTVPMVTRDMAASRVSQYLFHDPIEVARALVPVLTRQADMVVALTHLGLKRDRELALQVPGIQMIVGGHTHDLLGEPEYVNGTVILHAGCYARYVGRVEVTLENRRVSVRSRLIPLGRERGGTEPRP